MKKLLSKFGLQTYRANSWWSNTEHIHKIYQFPINFISAGTTVLEITSCESMRDVYARQNCILLKMYVKKDQEIQNKQELFTVFNFPSLCDNIT